MKTYLASLFLAFVFLPIGQLEQLSGQETKDRSSDEVDSTERDYKDDLPRIEPTSPQDALAKFNVAQGFKIELVASEPQVVDPVAIAIDSNMRLYVVEMRGYSEQDHELLGRVRVLEDLNGDGHYEKGTIFADGLSWPTAITCYDGGVFVGAAPDIIYLKDHDGDQVADEKKVVFTGFGKGNVQGLINTFKWGMDNRIHGATSSSGAQIELTNNGEKRTLTLKGRDFSFDPKTLDFQATSGGGQHGLTFNAWGEKFVCSNSNHLQFITYADHYVARNPYLAAKGARVSIAADGPQADVYRTSPVEAWRIIRTRLRTQGIVPGPIERGGKAAGYFTGATGATIYRGNAWPSTFQGWAIIGDVGSNLIHRKKLENSELSYIGLRVDENAEFLTSTDNWFRPVQFSNAPDGSLYVLDMYREVIEHPKSLPPVLKKHIDLTNGRDRGRIYRIVPDDFHQVRLQKLNDLSLEDLVATLAHPNGWHRETAARLLYERGDTKSISLLRKQLLDNREAETTVWTLAVLDGLDGLDADSALLVLKHENPQVRRIAVKLSETVANQSAEVRARLYTLSADPNIKVRFQVAFSLGAIKDPQRISRLADIAQRDGADPLMRMAIQSSVFDGAGQLLTRLANQATFFDGSPRNELVKSLAAQIGKQKDSSDLAELYTLLPTLASQFPRRTEVIVSSLAIAKGSPLATRIDRITGGLSQSIVAAMVLDAIKKAESKTATTESRIESIHLLRLGEEGQTIPVLASFLDPAYPPQVQAAAIDTLGQINSEQIATLIIEAWPRLAPQVRTRAANLMLSRTGWIESLLSSVEEEKISRSDIAANQLFPIFNHSNPKIASRAQQIFRAEPSGTAGELLKRYRPALSQNGNVANGQKVFEKHCSKCHRVGKIGFEIGPNLAAMKNRGAESVLVNVLAPNQEVNPQYHSYIIETVDGRLLSGIVAEETSTTVTLLQGENLMQSILRIDIERMQSTGKSLMPEGLEKEIDVQAMADLLRFVETLQ